jgi:hypothetical protein
MSNPICLHCNGIYAAEDRDGWLTCPECGFRFSRTTTGVLIMTGPTGETLLLPIESERHTAEAGQGHTVELTGSLPSSQLSDLQDAAEAIGQAGHGGNRFFPPDPQAPHAVHNPRAAVRGLEHLSALLNFIGKILSRDNRGCCRPAHRKERGHRVAI